jgi:ribosome-associated translation inhibitor RaiA
MNRIAVSADEGLSAQARTYAEYRVFSVVARHTRSVRQIRVKLRGLAENGNCQRVACTVIVDLESSPSLRIRAAGPHAYAAINRAVERLEAAMPRELEQPVSS